MRPRAPDEGDYRDGQGFLICGKCHTRKECEIDWLGAIKRLPCPCNCKLAELEAEKKADLIQRKKDRINNSLEWLRGIGCSITPEATFSKNDGKSKRNTEIATRYVDKFDVIEDGFGIAADGIGLTMYGEAGCGKTFFAECIANAMLEAGKFVWMTRIQDVAAAMNANYQENRPEILRYIREVDLLILDDFGAERGTPYMVEQAYAIINERYGAKAPMIVTTNFSPADMENEQDIDFKRLYQRVLERCIKFHIEGSTRRTAYSRENTARTKKMLGLE